MFTPCHCNDYRECDAYRARLRVERMRDFTLTHLKNTELYDLYEREVRDLFDETGHDVHGFDVLGYRR